MYIKRTIESRLIEFSKNFPVLLLTGARQVGKTTVLKNTNFCKDINYVSLDYPNLRSLARQDPELFLQTYPAPIIIDEIQYAPELFPYIKIRVDQDNSSGQYFLTGSQIFHLMQNVSESLAGRVGLLILNPLSRAEIYGYDEIHFTPSLTMKVHRNESINDVFESIYCGAMPKMIASANLRPEDFYASYVQTYIERDIKSLAFIQNEDKFLKFMSSLATRTAQELNLSDISKDVGVDGKTVDRWISILRTSGLIYLLMPYSSNVIKRIIKRPKLFFMDTGLACYLSLWNNPKALQVSAMAGQMFETYVVSEIIKTYTNSGLDPRTRLFYYRDNNKREIDLIVSENDCVYPIEIKKSASPKKDAIKHFSVLDNVDAKRGKGIVISMSPLIVPIDQDNMVVPIGCI
ncbi:MAG: ATPase [Clostridiales bacterium]|nr:MAG: ATPase [Clostridiales bacterium]